MAEPRPTPYQVVFADLEAELFPPIRAEAAARGVDTRDRERFGFLTSVADALRVLLPPDAAPEMRDQLGVLLFHAFAFWKAGQPVLEITPALARYLVEAAPQVGNRELALLDSGSYLQLPPNLFWASTAPDATPEPVDGVFVVSGADYFHGLMALGVRRGRPGFSVVPVEAELRPGGPAGWATERARAEGADFATTLPGGELRGLYSVVTTAEAIKLVARILWYLDGHPQHVAPDDAGVRRVDLG